MMSMDIATAITRCKGLMGKVHHGTRGYFANNDEIIALRTIIEELEKGCDSLRLDFIVKTGLMVSRRRQATEQYNSARHGSNLPETRPVYVCEWYDPATTDLFCQSPDDGHETARAAIDAAMGISRLSKITERKKSEGRNPI